MNPVNGKVPLAPDANIERDMQANTETLDALNAALVAALTGIEPQLRPDGQWCWTFKNEQDEALEFVGKPPQWVQGDMATLMNALHDLQARDGFVYSIMTKCVPSEDGLVSLRSQVKIGVLDPVKKVIVPRAKAEAEPPETAVGAALAAYMRLDIEAWKARLFPQLALATAAAVRAD